MAFDWTAGENAIYAWVQGTSGLGASSVLWSDQNSDRPGIPFIRIKIGDTAILGAVDEVMQTYDSGAILGHEVIQTVLGQRRLVVSIQAYSPDATGPATARALLDKVFTALGLPSVDAALRAAGFSVLSKGKVQNISAVLDAGFESRAIVEITMGYVDDVSETTGYIAEVDVTDTTTGHVIVVP